MYVCTKLGLCKAHICQRRMFKMTVNRSLRAPPHHATLLTNAIICKFRLLNRMPVVMVCLKLTPCDLSTRFGVFAFQGACVVNQEQLFGTQMSSAAYSFGRIPVFGQLCKTICSCSSSIIPISLCKDDEGYLCLADGYGSHEHEQANCALAPGRL